MRNLGKITPLRRLRTCVRTAVLCMVMGGCGATTPYGSFVRGRDGAQAAIASDAATKIASVYAPEGRSVRLDQEGGDGFGRRFAAELRRKGYALKDRSAAASQGELRLQYVLDLIKGTDLLRVTIYAPGRRLSRAYAERSERLLPAGPWSSGEAR